MVGQHSRGRKGNGARRDGDQLFIGDERYVRDQASARDGAWPAAGQSRAPPHDEMIAKTALCRPAHRHSEFSAGTRAIGLKAAQFRLGGPNGISGTCSYRGRRDCRSRTRRTKGDAGGPQNGLVTESSADMTFQISSATH